MNQMLRTGIFCLICFTLLPLCDAQGPPEGPPQPIRKVLFGGSGTAVKVLDYDPDFAPGNWYRAPKGTQRASFALSLSGTQAPEGCSGPEAYEWTPLRPTNKDIQPTLGALVMSG